MSSDLGEELKQFERDLATIVARFLKLYERVESNVRPGRAPPTPPPGLTPGPAPPSPKAAQLVLPGYQ